MRLCVIAALCGMVAMEASRGAGGRERISLNGAWEMAMTRSLDPPRDGTPWKAVRVPALHEGKALGGSDYAWFRRGLEVPEGWEGRRIFLRLGGARYHPRVHVDGRLIGQRLEGWTPFEVELTRHVFPGQSHRVTVCCQDWGATFGDGFQLPADYLGDWHTLRGAPRGKIIAPIGGLFTLYGMWDDVSLVARPNRYLADVAVETSVRRGRLTVRGGGAGLVPGMRVAGRVLNGAAVALEMTACPVGDTGRWELSADFPGAHHWSPEDPHLYILELTLEPEDAPGVLDTHRIRFGFRELWTQGADFYFNGIKRHLLASSGWPARGDQTREEVRRSLQAMKDGNNVCFRLHTQPWQEKWLDRADEVGIMIVEEGALWCDGSGGYGFADKRFWSNTAEHLLGMVRRDRNHASLVMWSIENEILHCGAMRHHPGTETELAELGRDVKRLDPTHLITYEADLDPGGVADVVGLHYPHEMPEHADYPNTADWLSRAVETGTGGELLGSRHKRFRWDRKKPLYIGEYLWVPWEDFSPGSVFFGDDAYRDRHRYKQAAKALAWEYQTLAYRRAGVSGLCPWTFAGSGGQFSTNSILYQAQKRAYEPLAVFPRELDTRFFGGTTTLRRYDVFNDTVEAVTCSLHLSQEIEGVPFKVGVEGLTLAPAEHRVVPLVLALPRVGRPETLDISVELAVGNRVVHRYDASLSLYPTRTVAVPRGLGVVVFDPGGNLAGCLAGPRCRHIDSLEALGAGTDAVLVIGPCALQPSRSPTNDVYVIDGRVSGSGALRRFLLEGGRALVLEQETLDGLALGVHLVEHASTMTFPVSASHPLLAGIAPGDLKFWSDGHYVTRHEISRPDRFGGKAIVVSGGKDALAQCAVAEVPVGRGRLLLCQALVGEKAMIEPAARRILENALGYLACAPRGSVPRPTPVIGATASFAARLSGMGVSFQRLAPEDGTGGLAASPTLILHGGNVTWARKEIAEWFAQGTGRTLYWHAPDPRAFEAMRTSVGAGELAIRPGSGPLRLYAREHPLLAGICREDIAYAGPVEGRSWMRGFQLDPEVSDRLVCCRVGEVPADRFEAEDMRLSGGIVEVTPDGRGVIMATVGEARTRVTVRDAGLHRITIVAGGTDVDGVYPVVSLRANGEPTAQVTLTEGRTRAYAVLGMLPVGEVEITVAFVNDLTQNGQDRNLMLDAIAVDRTPIGDGGVEFLTMPPALAAARCGRNRLVLDGIRWDTAKRNALKGRRYASALLGNLGVAFKPPPPAASWIPTAQFDAVGKIAFFRKEESELGLFSAGVVGADFECIRDGEYSVVLSGHSTPARGEYAEARISIDGRTLETVMVSSAATAEFDAGALRLGKGKHRVEVAFVNDLQAGGEDRNLLVRGVGFRPIAVR